MNIPPLYDYQKVGVSFLKENPRSILADDMGLGKGCQTLTAIRETYQEGEQNLILCPKGVKPVWETEQIPLWFPTASCVVIDSLEQGEEVLRQKTLPTFTILNYAQIIEIKRKDKTTGLPYIEDRLLPLLKKKRFRRVVFDEAHHLRNRQSNTFKAAKALARLSYLESLYCLTGTPLYNKPEDLWALLHLLDPKEFSSFWRWADEVCYSVYDPFAYNKKGVGKVRDPDGLKTDLSKWVLRRTKKDALDLPPRTFVNVPVNLTPDQRRIYDHLRKRRHVTYKGHTVEAVNHLSLRTYLQEIAISPDLLIKDDTSNLTPLTGAKVDTLRDLIDGIGEQKYLIFSQFASVLTRLNRIFPRTTLYTGNQSARERKRSVERFTEDPEVDGMLVTYSAGAEGATWNTASVVFCIDRTPVPAANNQAIDRCYRIGQTQPVTVYSLIALRTMESRLQQILGDKEALFNAVIPESRIDRILNDILTEED